MSIGFVINLLSKGIEISKTVAIFVVFIAMAAVFDALNFPFGIGVLMFIYGVWALYKTWARRT